MRSTNFDSRVNENTAAAVMLTTPAIVVTSSIESSVELMLDLDGKGGGIKAQPPRFRQTGALID
jgi:aconitase A